MDASIPQDDIGVDKELKLPNGWTAKLSRRSTRPTTPFLLQIGKLKADGKVINI